MLSLSSTHGFRLGIADLPCGDEFNCRRAKASSGACTRGCTRALVHSCVQTTGTLGLTCVE